MQKSNPIQHKTTIFLKLEILNHVVKMKEIEISNKICITKRSIGFS